MSLYEIIKQLQNTSGTNDKLAILEANKDDTLLREYLKACLDPAINFYITAKTIPKQKSESVAVIDSVAIDKVVLVIGGREQTGADAKEYIQRWLNILTKQDAELLTMMLLKDIKAKVGVTLVNKVWSNLIFEVPYQRCSLFDDKAKKKFAALDSFYVQNKFDGSFAYIVADDDISVVTRNGSIYPKWVGEHFNKHPTAFQTKGVLCGEMLVERNGKTLSRKEGNGILNSVLQGSMLDEGEQIVFMAWDEIELVGWKAGVSNTPYSTRLNSLYKRLAYIGDTNMRHVKTNVVESVSEAYKLYQEALANGEEGVIIKDPNGIWKDTTSKDCVKLKLEVDVELEIVDIIEGTGKAAGMMGSLLCKSRCGKLVVNVGTGFSDAERIHFWKTKSYWVGSVAAVKANDILTKEGSETKSLFLPVHIEVRTDKSVADTLEQIEAQFNAAKGISA